MKAVNVFDWPHRHTQAHNYTHMTYGDWPTIFFMFVAVFSCVDAAVAFVVSKYTIHKKASKKKEYQQQDPQKNQTKKKYTKQNLDFSKHMCAFKCK